MCVCLVCTGRIIVDLQGLLTMSRPTPGTHTQSLSQWNAANSYLKLPHRHCPSYSPGQGRAGDSECSREGHRVLLAITFSVNSCCWFHLHNILISYLLMSFMRRLCKTNMCVCGGVGCLCVILENIGVICLRSAHAKTLQDLIGFALNNSEVSHFKEIALIPGQQVNVWTVLFY